MSEITIVGGGVAGLTAAITAAEQGADVKLFEASDTLGGRGRSTDGPYKANLGPHALYRGGGSFDWLTSRDLMPPFARPRYTGLRVHYEGKVHRAPPLSVIGPAVRMRGRAPADQDFRSWATDHGVKERAADMLANLGGVYAYHHDPGELSAAFVWERTRRLLLTARPPVRYVVGGWTKLVESLAGRARSMGVEILTGESVDKLPEPPVIVALELCDARELLADESLRWPSGHAVCLDIGLTKRRGDPWIVSDLDNAGWAGRYSAQDATLAPKGEQLIQSHMPIRPDETPDAAAERLEELLDRSFDGWRERTTWRRRLVMEARTGAVDLPGRTWRDRPAIDRGDGVFLCGDQVAAPGLLSEVSFASAIEAGRLAAEYAGRGSVRSAA